MKQIILVCLLCMALVSCTTTKYVEVPIPIEKTKTEYVHNTDSIYLHDSIYTSVIQKGDTIFIDRYKYKIKEVYKTDTLHRVDSIPSIVTITKVQEVNKLYSWQKLLMYIGGVGIFILILFIINKLKLWKLLS